MAVSLTTMYAPQNNGPHTALAEAINAAQTDISVVDASVLPAAPNVLTIGTGEDAELVLMSAKTGNIITVTRGYNGTAAKSWETDEWVYRAITAQDVSALQANVNAINTGKVDAESGKGLSSNDYTTTEKQKLAGVAAGANNYVHPSTHPASMIAAGTLAGQVKADATAVAALDVAQVRSIRAGTADLTPGESALASGEMYLVYE